MCLADVPLKQFLNEALIDYERDEVTRLIMDEHDAAAFYPIAHFTVGDFRNWPLSDDASTEKLQALQAGLTPEMAAAVSKIMRNQDLIFGGEEMLRSHAIPQYDRLGKGTVDAPAAQSPDR